MEEYIKVKDLKYRDLKKYLPKLSLYILKNILEKDRISKLDIEALKKIGFKHKELYCKNNYLKTVFNNKSKDLFLLYNTKKQEEYLCIGLCKHMYNSCWMQFIINNKENI